MYYFVDARQAMAWSTEVLRKRRFAQNGAFYMDTTSDEENEPQVRQFYGQQGGHLPTSLDERMLLATRVQGMLNSVEEKYREALLYLYWGDYLHDDGYRKATFVQEYLRQKGVRTRLSYRYSYRQVGARLGIDHKTAHRWEGEGLKQLHGALQRFGLLEMVQLDTLTA